jgi:peptidyl-prolyl cis-trans isomerase SurA
MMKHLAQTHLKYIAASFFLILTLVGKSQNDVIIDKIIVKVDNYIILKSDLEKSYLDFLSRGQLNTGNLRCEILESLIVNKLMLAKAEIDSVVVSDVEVNANMGQRIDYMISQVGSVEEIEKFYGKSMKQIESELFDQIKEQLVIQRMQGEITDGIKVTPKEVQTFFKSIPQDSLPYFSTEVIVGVIVMKPKAGFEQQQKAESQLLEIRRQILAGESFSTLARRYSEDPGSAANGGQLPFYKRGELAPEFEAAAMTMSPGELSMPIKTDFGYHLIELQERRGNTFKTRHILIMPKPSQEDITNRRQELDSIRTLIVTDQANFRTMAKEHSDDKNTSFNGGFYSAGDGAERVPV